MESKPRIIISRTDALGDVVLTLPLAARIKQALPDTELYFLARSYARPIVEACRHIDHFIDRDYILMRPDELLKVGARAIIHASPDQAVATLADRIKIVDRIGTSHRSFHWLRCNRLVHFSRKGSALHEAQLNFRLLEPLGIDDHIDLAQLPPLYGLDVSPNLHGLSDPADKRYRLILHPKSSGSAREWPLDHFQKLAASLDPALFSIFISGLAEEGHTAREAAPGLFSLPHVTDITGLLSLADFMQFIAACDGLVAASTGPLHIASALGLKTMGLYPPIKPMHPARWAPVGLHSGFMVRHIACSACRKTPDHCPCMAYITPEAVADYFRLAESGEDDPKQQRATRR